MKLILSESLFHNSNGIDYEVLFKNKEGDALVKDVNRDKWICAYRLGEKEWAQGHYFDNYEDAKVYWDIHYADAVEEDLDLDQLNQEQYVIHFGDRGVHNVRGSREKAEKIAQKYRDRGIENVYVVGREDLSSEDIDDSLSKLKEFQKEENLSEDIVKKSNGKWTNRGDDGEEHGEFKTKKEAAAQTRAMYARGFKHESLEESDDDDDDEVYDYHDRFTATAHEDDSYDSPVASVDSNNIQKIIDFAWHMIRGGYYIFAIEHPSSDIECIAPEEILNSGDAREKLERRLMSIVHDID